MKLAWKKKIREAGEDIRHSSAGIREAKREQDIPVEGGCQ
jgi:hypothetical protein